MTVRCVLTAVRRRSTRRSRITIEWTLVAPTVDKALMVAVERFRQATGLTPSLTVL